MPELEAADEPDDLLALEAVLRAYVAAIDAGVEALGAHGVRQDVHAVGLCADARREALQLFRDHEDGVGALEEPRLDLLGGALEHELAVLLLLDRERCVDFEQQRDAEALCDLGAGVPEQRVALVDAVGLEAVEGRRRGALQVLVVKQAAVLGRQVVWLRHVLRHYLCDVGHYAVEVHRVEGRVTGRSALGVDGGRKHLHDVAQRLQRLHDRPQVHRRSFGAEDRYPDVAADVGDSHDASRVCDLVYARLGVFTSRCAPAKLRPRAAR